MEWQPAEGTLVDIRTTHFGSGGTAHVKGAKLERLTELHERGALTDAEFEAQMRSILRSS